MKIISYNVNGLRASLSKGFIDWMRNNDFDVICLQEVKANIDQLDISIFEELGYNFYLHSAEKKGYSGVAILSKQKPLNIVKGINISKYDKEGRVIRLDFPNLSVISVYIPSGTSGEDRQEVKMEFLKDFQYFINDVKKTCPKLVIAGDYNICHKEIDINNPKKHVKMSGFLPEERTWFDNYLNSGLIDSFRILNQESEQYTWWSYRANAKIKNLGWRIDYCIVTDLLKNDIEKVDIFSTIDFSDHCPILLQLNV